MGKLSEFDAIYPGIPRHRKTYQPIIVRQQRYLRNPNHPLIVNITNTTFSASSGRPAFQLDSCLLPNASSPVYLEIQFSKFVRNHKSSIEIRPAVNLLARIGNNSFTDNRFGSIWIENMRYALDSGWRDLRTNVEIAENKFTSPNSAIVVILGLTEAAGRRQRLMFAKNKVLVSRQTIQAQSSLHQKAAVIVGSSNVQVVYNSFEFIPTKEPARFSDYSPFYHESPSQTAETSGAFYWIASHLQVR